MKVIYNILKLFSSAVFFLHLPLNFLFRDKTQLLLKSRALTELCDILSFGKLKNIRSKGSIFLHLSIVFIFQLLTPILVISLLFYFVFAINVLTLNWSFYQEQYLAFVYIIYVLYIMLFCVCSFIVNLFNYKQFGYNISNMSTDQAFFGDKELISYNDLKNILRLYLGIIDKEKPEKSHLFSLKTKKQRQIKLDLIMKLLNIPILLINQIGFFLLLIFLIAQVPVLLLFYFLGIIGEYRKTIADHNKKVEEYFDQESIKLNKLYFKQSLGNIKEKYYCILIALLICIPHILFKESSIIDTYKIFLDEISFNAISLFTIHSESSMPILLSLLFWVMIIISDLLYLGTIFNFFKDLDDDFQINLYLKPDDFFDVLIINNEINTEYNYNRSIMLKGEKKIQEYSITQLIVVINEIMETAHKIDSSIKEEEEALFFKLGYFNLIMVKQDFYFLYSDVLAARDPDQTGVVFPFVKTAYHSNTFKDFIRKSRRINNLNSIGLVAKNNRIFQPLDTNKPRSEQRIDPYARRQYAIVNGFVDEYNSGECDTWDEYISKVQI